MVRSFLRRWHAVFREDPLFKIAVFLIPFENFFFAPSKGWAAIAPIFFFLYCLANVRHLRRSVWHLRRILLVVGLAVGLSSLNFLASPPQAANLFDVLRSLGLGLSFLVALDLHFNVHGRRPGHTVRVLVAAYGVSLLFGVVQLLVIQLRLLDLREILIAMSKRTTLKEGRVQFTFTEPAYISMHVYGVLLPLLVMLRGQRTVWRLRWVLAAFVAVALMSRPSLRFILDTAVVCGLWLLIGLLTGGRRQRGMALGVVVVMAGAAVFFYQTSSRIRDIVQRGVYADGSLAARWFRVHASAVAYREQPLRAAVGWGLSNAWVPLHIGYEEAWAAYRSDNQEGIRKLQTQRPTSVLCMPIRMVSEFGVALALLMVALMFDRRYPFVFAVMLYVYLPFDSYAFYAVWIYVFFAKARPASAHH